MVDQVCDNILFGPSSDPPPSPISYKFLFCPPALYFIILEWTKYPGKKNYLVFGTWSSVLNHLGNCKIGCSWLSYFAWYFKYSKSLYLIVSPLVYCKIKFWYTPPYGTYHILLERPLRPYSQVQFKLKMIWVLTQ